MDAIQARLGRDSRDFGQPSREGVSPGIREPIPLRPPRSGVANERGPFIGDQVNIHFERIGALRPQARRPPGYSPVRQTMPRDARGARGPAPPTRRFCQSVGPWFAWNRAFFWPAARTIPRIAAQQTPRPMLTRRRFLQTSTAAASLVLAPRWSPAAEPAAKSSAFSFVLLGDIHYDKLEHHDMAWVQKDKPNDVSQIQNYSRISREISPRLLSTVRETIAELNKSPATRVAFVLQAGDLVEGLCGNEELAARQNSESLAFIREGNLGVPLLFTKGNHDVTGPGAVAAFGSVFHPFLTAQARGVNAGSAEVKSGSYTVDCGNAQFAFFDAYEASKSLDWFEAVAAKRAAEHFFVVVHPPVVPYGARSTWHIFSSEKDRTRREKFLTLLGDQKALVLGGHIHRYNLLVRSAGKGRFSQLALSSVISSATVQQKMPFFGLDRYTPDQIVVEPNFSPANETERRAVYTAERPFVSAFEYADLPGYAVVRVEGDRVTARIYSGITRDLWRTVELNPAHVKT